MESCSNRVVCKRITFSQKFDISLCSCMVNGIWIACSKFLHSMPIYQEVTFDLLLTKICVVVNRDLANYLWKREFLVAEMSQYSLQHILNDFLSYSSFFEHIELFRCVLHWLNDFFSSSGNPGNHCSTISNYGIFDMLCVVQIRRAPPPSRARVGTSLFSSSIVGDVPTSGATVWSDVPTGGATVWSDVPNLAREGGGTRPIWTTHNHDPVFVIYPRICNKITAPHSVIRLVVSPKTYHIESLNSW